MKGHRVGDDLYEQPLYMQREWKEDGWKKVVITRCLACRKTDEGTASEAAYRLKYAMIWIFLSSACMVVNSWWQCNLHSRQVASHSIPVHLYCWHYIYVHRPEYNYTSKWRALIRSPQLYVTESTLYMNSKTHIPRVCLNIVYYCRSKIVLKRLFTQTVPYTLLCTGCTLHYFVMCLWSVSS